MDRVSQTSTPPAPEDACQYYEKRYDSLGLDLDGDLDKWAGKHATQLKRRGFKYPKKGSLADKWLALKNGLSVKEQQLELTELVERCRAFIKQLDDALSLSSYKHYQSVLVSESELHPDKLEQMLSDERIRSSGLKSLIDEVRECIRALQRYM